MAGQMLWPRNSRVSHNSIGCHDEEGLTHKPLTSFLQFEVFNIYIYVYVTFPTFFLCCASIRWHAEATTRCSRASIRKSNRPELPAPLPCRSQVKWTGWRSCCRSMPLQGQDYPCWMPVQQVANLWCQLLQGPLLPLLPPLPSLQSHCHWQMCKRRQQVLQRSEFLIAAMNKQNFLLIVMQ